MASGFCHSAALTVFSYLHGSVVNNHVLKLDLWVVLGNLLTAAQKETVAKFHDIGFVNGSNLLAAVLGCVIESKLGNSPRFFGGDNLKTLNHSRHRLVFQS